MLKSDSDTYYTRLLEAILFIAERPIAIEEIKMRLSIKDDNKFNPIIEKLRENLAERRSFIEIVELDQGRAIQMRLNPAKKREIEKFRTKKVLSKDLMGTLAYIALKQPIKYGALKKFRGSKAKAHIEALEKEGFIDIKPSGKTKILTTTLYFASVFNLDPDNLKETFKAEIKKRMMQLID
ncbi:MAG: SMC-Scp complex subunit ScpB [Candidatus Helarchaeota archaeon]